MINWKTEEDLGNLIRKICLVNFLLHIRFFSFLEQTFAREHFRNNNNTQYRFSILYLNTLGIAAEEYCGGVEGVALEQGQSTVYSSFSFVVFSV